MGAGSRSEDGDKCSHSGYFKHRVKQDFLEAWIRDVKGEKRVKMTVKFSLVQLLG